MTDLIECKECGRKFKKITESHVKTHGMSLDEYMMKYESDDNVKEDPDQETEEEQKVEEKEEKPRPEPKPKSRVFDFKEKEYAPLPLQEFLDDFKISEKDLRSIVRQYKDGRPISTHQQLRSKMDAASNKIDELKDLDECEVTNLQVAELLVKNHGFTAVEVRGRKGTGPKTWVLKKL